MKRIRLLLWQNITCTEYNQTNKKIVHIRLRPRCRHLASSTKHNVMHDFDLLATSCGDKMTSSTKPEVHNVLRFCLFDYVHCHRNMYGKFGKIGMWFLRYASGQTDKQTIIQTYRRAVRNEWPTYWGKNNNTTNFALQSLAPLHHYYI